MSGWQVAEEIRVGGGRCPYLIALTGRDQPLDRVSSAQARIDLHLLKGSDPNELLGALEGFRASLQP